MVAVLDRHHKQLMPCTEKRARLLLTKKRAVIHKMAPFTIRMKDRLLENSTLQPLRLKLDPGSKTTGFAVLREVSDNEAVAVILGEIHHKHGIKQNLDSRRALRRGRRNRHTRYRKPRFLNRTRPAGWLPQSLEARVNQTMNTVTKLRKLLPITSASTEHVKFDTQLLQNADIQGVEYQQGTLLGYEVKEYLLERDKRTCCYCGGLSLDPVLEIEHKIPKSQGGSNSIKNLLMACRTCNNDGNDAKGSMTTDEGFVSKGRLTHITWAVFLLNTRKMHEEFLNEAERQKENASNEL
jgi:5-methylcytosine-specific restriction endonuclease McrA